MNDQAPPALADDVDAIVRAWSGSALGAVFVLLLSAGCLALAGALLGLGRVAPATITRREASRARRRAGLAGWGLVSPLAVAPDGLVEAPEGEGGTLTHPEVAPTPLEAVPASLLAERPRRRRRL